MIRINDPDIFVIVFGQHCWNTLGQIRSFGELGVNPDVIWIIGDSVVPSKSKYINHFHEFESFEDGFEYLKKEYCDKNRTYIVSTDSDAVVSLLNLHYDELKDRFVFFNATQQGRLNRFMPKHVQYLLAEKYGLRIPKMELVKKGLRPNHLKYPLITKTDDSFSRNWKKNYVICHSEQELFEAYKFITPDTVLLQEFIEKKNEVALEGISINKGEDVFIPIQGEYLRIEAGSYGSWKRNEVYSLGDELKEKLQQMLKEIKYVGVFEVEFLKDMNDNLFFLEINFRHTQYNQALSEMGVNFCKIFAESVLNNRLSIESIDGIRSPHLVMNERRDFDTYIRTKKYSLRKWINDIIKTDSFYIYNKHDKCPFYSYMLSLIKGRLLSCFYRIKK